MIRKATFVVKEIILRTKYIMDKDCLFCKMVAGSVKTKPVYESELVLAIRDINPSAPVHILIIPKKHIDSVLAIGEQDSSEIVEMFAAARQLARKQKLDAFRLAFNG